MHTLPLSIVRTASHAIQYRPKLYMSVPLERRRVNIKLPLELDRKVENDMGTRGIDKISWIREAVAEKLDRIDRKRDRGWVRLRNFQKRIEKWYSG